MIAPAASPASLLLPSRSLSPLRSVLRTPHRPAAGLSLLSIVLLSGLPACIESRPLPFVGDCASYPSGTYEYGQIGIGTCLSAPADIIPLATDGQFAVVNANAWGDYTGGSVSVIDLANVDESLGRQTMTAIGTTAVDLPSLSGAATLVDDGLLAVTNRLSPGARTREQTDDLYFVDVTDPAAPALATGVTDTGSSIGIGYDPNAIAFDPATKLAYVLDRTSHQITILDTSTRPVAIVPPGGDATIDAYTFEDADNSGSRASFAELVTEDATSLSPTGWEMGWDPGTIRAWRPAIGTAAGLSRETGNAEGLWTATTGAPDVRASDFGALNDPYFYLDLDGNPHILYIDATSGGITDIDGNVSQLTSWAAGSPLLATEASGAETVIGGPSLLEQSGLWSLFYDAGDGVTQSIALATSVDGSRYDRDGTVVAIDGASLTDPFVLYDSAVGRYHMWFSVDDGADGVGDGIGEAWSDDLTTWTATANRFTPVTGAHSPVVTWIDGVFHMLYTVPGVHPYAGEATSVDGTNWTVLGAAFPLQTVGGGDARMAIQGTTEGTFSLTGTNGSVFTLAITPGVEVEDPVDGWKLIATAGQSVDPADAGDYSVGGVQLDSWVGDEAYVTFYDANGVGSIGRAALGAGDELVVESAPVLTAPSGIDSLASAVVFDDNGTLRMYVGGTSNGLTSVYTATSADAGATWTLDTAPVFVPSTDWDSVGTIPGSVDVESNGTIDLWYTGTDGSNPRVGLAQSTDGTSFTRVAGPDAQWMLNAGAPGDWDDSGVKDPMAQVDDNGTIHLWFSGFDGNQWHLGYAEDADGLSGTGAFAVSTDINGSPRAVMDPAEGSFGASDLVRPVTVPTTDGWTLWYTGLDSGVGRSGKGILHDPDRAWRAPALPTRSDTWGFVAQPANPEGAIDLDVTVDGTTLAPVRGCAALARDDDRGFLYVTCKLEPYIFVVDIRDDTDTATGGSFVDLNYLQVESVISVSTSTGGSAGPRAAIIDPVRNWLWTISNTPSSLIAFDLNAVEDNADIEYVYDDMAAMLPLPRGNSRDEGVNTEADVGPGQLVMHPDGHHLFVTNYNDNSVSCYDLSVGAFGTLVGETTDLGENPYSIALNADGTRGLIGNYSGEVDGTATNATIVVLDTDPTSPTFLQPLTWLVNK